MSEISPNQADGTSFAWEIEEVAQAFEESAALGAKSVKQSKAYVSTLLKNPKALEQVAHLAGKTPEEVHKNLDTVALQYHRFMRQLAKNPLLLDGCISMRVLQETICAP